MEFPTFYLEKNYWENNRKVVGLDEAGRGALAGPVFAAAVVFPVFFDLESKVIDYFSEKIESINEHNDLSYGSKKTISIYHRFIDNPKLLINDSKKLESEVRELAYDFIVKNVISFSVAKINCDIIDKINILQATQLAFRSTLDKLELTNEYLLVDGNYFRQYKELEYETIIKGDAKSLSIAAASIIAKVSRDSFLKTIVHNKYSEYGFDHHFGYATKYHFEAIEKYGETEFHRKSFLKKYYDRRSVDKLIPRLF